MNPGCRRSAATGKDDSGCGSGVGAASLMMMVVVVMMVVTVITTVIVVMVMVMVMVVMVVSGVAADDNRVNRVHNFGGRRLAHGPAT